MAASGGKILEDFYNEIQRLADRQEHALGYAPGMDQLEMDDWSELNEFIKEMRKKYTRLNQKYSWQIGVTAEELSELQSECYEEYDRKGKPRDFDFLSCKKNKADFLKTRKFREQRRYD